LSGQESCGSATCRRRSTRRTSRVGLQAGMPSS
jgi:hypothetical protein